MFWCVLFFILLLSVVKYLYVPFPKEHTYSVKLRAFIQITEIFTKLSRLLEYLGYSFWFFLKKPPPVITLPDNMTVKTIDLDGVYAKIVYQNGFREQDTLQPAIIFYHGGGWVSMSPEAYLRMGNYFAKATNSMVVLPGYRQAPEHPFPIPYEDSLKAAKNFLQRSKEFNVDPHKIIVAGDSAGGNLAAAISFVVSFRMLVVIYPSLQFANFELPSYQQNANMPLLSKYFMIRFVIAYLGLDKYNDLFEDLANNRHTMSIDDASRNEKINRINEDLIPNKFKLREHVVLHKHSKPSEELQNFKEDILSKISDPRMAPLVASDEMLKQLPRTHVLTCEYDVLRDDGILLVERLKKININVTHQNLEYALHGQFGFGIRFKEEDMLKDAQILISLINKELQ